MKGVTLRRMIFNSDGIAEWREPNKNQHFFQQQTVQVGYDHRFGDPCGSSCHVYFVCTRDHF